MKTIEIIQVGHLSKLDNYFSSSMIDVAYVEKIEGETITLTVEDGINLDNIDDKKWLLDLLNQVLQKCEESSAKIIIE